MAPTLASGDYMIITKARALRPGFVVLVDHPKYGLMVKRVATVAKQTLTLEGDGPESKTTEALGTVAQANVQGRVRLAITPKGIIKL